METLQHKVHLIRNISQMIMNNIIVQCNITSVLQVQ